MILIAIANNALAWAESDSSDNQHQWIGKLNLVDFAFFSTPHLSVGLEFLPANKNIGLELEAGYIFRDADVNESASGFRFAQNTHFYLNAGKSLRHAISMGIYYQKSEVNTPLLFQTETRGLAHKEYKDGLLSKERYGLSISYKLNAFITNNIIIENSFGFGGTYFGSELPDNVIQQDVRNGITYGNNQFLPNVFGKVKLAYLF
jgi:hypothetical protein